MQHPSNDNTITNLKMLLAGSLTYGVLMTFLSSYLFTSQLRDDATPSTSSTTIKIEYQRHVSREPKS